METTPPTRVGRPDDGRIPVTLLTGFLGAGKTTLLNRLVGREEMAGTALIVNEFGEIGIDHQLVRTRDDQMMILESGCLCCTMNGSLIDALKSLHERMSKREIPPIRRVIVETTGLADPVPVVGTLMENPHLSVRYVCDGIVTVVDATLGLDQIARHEEALRQVSIADLLVLGKCDLAPRPIRTRLRTELSRTNPSARFVEMRHGDVGPDELFGTGLYAAGRPARSIDDWIGWTTPGRHGASTVGVERVRVSGPRCCDRATHGPACDCADPEETATGEIGSSGPRSGVHGTEIASFVVTFAAPVAWRSLAVAVGRILSRFGDRLLRVKGLLRVLGEEAPVVVQCVRDAAYAPVRLPRWPAEGAFADRRGRLVFIVEGIGPEGEAEIRAQLQSLPSDGAAVRILARHPDLPTRCWLSARLPMLDRGAFETAGWVVMPRRFATAAHPAGPGA